MSNHSLSVRVDKVTYSFPILRCLRVTPLLISLTSPISQHKTHYGKSFLTSLRLVERSAGLHEVLALRDIAFDATDMKFQAAYVV